MGQLAEIIFEGVSPGDLEAVLLGFVAHGSLNPTDQAQIASFAIRHSEGAISLYPLTLAIGNLRLENGACRILRYRGNCDVEINWDHDLLAAGFAKQWIKAAHRRAMETAGRHRVTQYYAGLEPAVDVETRFFTCSSKGPLRIL